MEKEEPRKVETPVEKTTVRVAPVKKCDHKGKLETISASEAEIDIPSTVEGRLDILRCKSCEAIIVKDKK